MYKIVGADNREYGPVSREEILQWIAQGRANAKTVARFEEGAWKPLGTFDEFKAALNIPAGPPLLGDSSIPPAPGFETPKTNSSAITALVSGILGLLCCPCIGPIIAIAFGMSSLNQIKANPKAYSTDAMIPKIAIGLGVAGLLLAFFQVLYLVLGGGLAALQEMSK